MTVRDGDLGNTEKAITVPDLCANRIENWPWHNFEEWVNAGRQGSPIVLNIYPVELIIFQKTFSATWNKGNCELGTVTLAMQLTLYMIVYFPASTTPPAFQSELSQAGSVQINYLVFSFSTLPILYSCQFSNLSNSLIFPILLSFQLPSLLTSLVFPILYSFHYILSSSIVFQGSRYHICT